MGRKSDNKYVCGDNVNDPKVINNAAELLAVVIKRMWDLYVWDLWWLNKHKEEWLLKKKAIEEKLKGKYNNEVIDVVLSHLDKFIRYVDEFGDYWLRNHVSDEIERLIENLLHGRSEIIVWRNENGVSVYGEHVTLNAQKTRTGVMVHLMPKDFDGITIEVPNIFKRTMDKRDYRKFVRKVLKALKGGFEETDGFRKRGRAAMGTNQVWQAIIWSLLYPGKVHINIGTVNVNKRDVKITWYLRANSHKPLKGLSLKDANKLSMEEILAFTLTAVLGDGSAHIKKIIEIAISGKKFEKWKPLLNRLWGMGFKWNTHPKDPNANIIKVRFLSNYAINLARSMVIVLPPILRDILDALNFKKWTNIRRIAEMEVKRRKGESQIEIVGIKFTLNVQKSTVVLERKAKNEVEVKRILNMLKIKYGDEFIKYIHINRSGKYLVVVIPVRLIERYDDIKEQVVEILCRKYHKVKDERKRRK